MLWLTTVSKQAVGVFGGENTAVGMSVMSRQDIFKCFAGDSGEKRLPWVSCQASVNETASWA